MDSSVDSGEEAGKKKLSTSRSIEFTAEGIIAGAVLFAIIIGVLNYFNILSLSQIFPKQLGFLPHKSATVAMKTQNEPDVNFWTLSYPNIILKNSITKKADQANKTTDSSKRFDLYKQIFTYLSSMYTTSHDPKIKDALQTLSQFIAKEFPKNYSKELFQVSCLDISCGKADYPKEIIAIKDELNKNKKIEPVVRDSILNRFEAAAVADPKNKAGNYFIGLKELISEEKSLKDSDLKSIAQELKDFIKNAYPKEYQSTEKFNPKSLEL